MKILIVGGGSGGHITPAVAVMREILAERPRTRVEFWTDKKYYRNVVKITTEIGVKWGGKLEKGQVGEGFVWVRKIRAGKFRRYNWRFREYFENWDITIRDVIGKNLLGIVGFLAGLGQSWWRLRKRALRPDVIFLKGGFVGLPVGIVAGWLKIPVVLHESDAVMGVANKILAKRARVVAMGQEFDAEELKNGRWVGIPVAEEYKAVSATKQKALKKSFGFNEEKPLVVMTGGSQGSKHMNEVMREILPEILKIASVGMVAGRQRYEEMIDLKKYEKWEKAKLKSNFRMWEFNTAMYDLMGAADVVISRAGATTIAELAALARPAVILVPFEKLPGGHQVKNADKLAKIGAVRMVVDEKMVKKPELLLREVQELVRGSKKREGLVANLQKTMKKNATKNLAEIILEVAGK